MTKLLPILVGSLFWAVATQGSTYGKYGIQKRQPTVNQVVFAMLILSLALPSMLRTSYNDTFAYRRNFVYGETLPELLSNGTLHLLQNPAFAVYSALIRTFTDDTTIFFMFPAFFVQYSYMRFIRRHCPDFLMGIILYFCLGTYTFSLAAMKQAIATAILLYGVDFLIEGKTTRFYLAVFLAFLFHTYALCFLILPFFTSTPWTLRTFALLGGILFFMRNFESVINSFLEIANDSGKNVSGSEIIGTDSINPLRVAVYAVTPLFALVFRRYLFWGSADREHNILVNMSIISVSIMSVGLVSAANMFARMAQYFEFGMICSLPWIIRKTFDTQSARLVNLLAVSCFAVYFIYTNVYWMPFDDAYSRYTVMEYIKIVLRNLMFN